MPAGTGYLQIEVTESTVIESLDEAIESERALRCLEKHGCNQAQGFLFSQPLPAAQFVQWHPTHAVH